MQRFRNILFAADFSENSKEAFRAACSLATATRQGSSSSTFVEPNLVPEVPAYYGQQVVQYFPAADQTRRSTTRLNRSCARCTRPTEPLDVEYQVKEGEPSKTILRGCQGVWRDMIVIGTHGRTGLRWLLAGSVATQW